MSLNLVVLPVSSYDEHRMPIFNVNMVGEWGSNQKLFTQRSKNYYISFFNRSSIESYNDVKCVSIIFTYFNCWHTIFYYIPCSFQILQLNL